MTAEGEHRDRALALRAEGRVEEALAEYESALRRKPNDVAARIEAGALCCQLARYPQAIAHLRHLLQLRPQDPDLLQCLGWALERDGQLADAVEAYREAVSVVPGSAALRASLAAALARQDRTAEAVAEYGIALRLRPSEEGVHINLGNALWQLGRYGEAAAAYRDGLRHLPDSPGLHNNLGAVLVRLGNTTEGIGHYREALRLRPGYSQVHSSLLCALDYTDDYTPAERFAEALNWAECHANGLTATAAPLPNDRSEGRRLRLGYVAEARWDGCFVEPLLRAHNRDEFELYWYGLARHGFPEERVAQLGVHWCDITGVPDEAAAQKIRQDGIDILVDWEGHFGTGRPLLFARKPAPVQVSLPGYPNTTGMRAMDHRITDANADPPGWTEHLHTERLVRLPEVSACYGPPECAPAAGELPALRGGGIVFGSFNNRCKISARVVEVWSEILRRTPGSALLFHHMFAGTPEVSSDFRDPLVDLFGRHGIDSRRLRFVGCLPLDRHLHTIGTVDLALDPFPFSGMTTTLETLWMGVPLVTLAGKTHASRVGVSFLSAVGLQEFIGQTPGEYVEIAARTATELDRLARLRRELRDRMAASALTDAPRYTRVLEQAYRAMWRSAAVGAQD